MKKRDNPPNLKSASGSGFSFEDKVTALLFGGMLAGQSSLGLNWGGGVRSRRIAPGIW